MSKLDGRINKLEEHAGLVPVQHDDLNPFRWPEAWDAYGRLLEYGWGACRYAGYLYEAGRIQDLKELWVEIASREPHRMQPNERQLQWAVERMPDFLAEWKSEPWWREFPDPAGLSWQEYYALVYQEKVSNE